MPEQLPPGDRCSSRYDDGRIVEQCEREYGHDGIHTSHDNDGRATEWWTEHQLPEPAKADGLTYDEDSGHVTLHEGHTLGGRVTEGGDAEVWLLFPGLDLHRSRGHANCGPVEREAHMSAAFTVENLRAWCEEMLTVLIAQG